MLEYIDVYNRPVNIGDVIISKFNCIEAMGNVQYLGLYGVFIVGECETQVYSKANKVICYKLEDNTIDKNNVRNFKMQDWYDYCRCTIEYKDMLRRKVNPGDLILLGFTVKKVKYGLVVDNGRFLTQAGKLKKLDDEVGIVLYDLCEKEKEVQTDLIRLYNTNRQITVQNKSVKLKNDKEIGGVYYNRDKNYIYIYVGTCGYTVTYKNINKTTDSDVYDDIYLKLYCNSVFGKEVLDALRESKNIDLKDLVGHVLLQSDKELCIMPFWDKKLAQELLEKDRRSIVSNFVQLYHLDKSILPTLLNNFKNDPGSASVAEQISKSHNASCCWVQASYVKLGINYAKLGKVHIDTNILILDNDRFRVILNRK